MCSPPAGESKASMRQRLKSPVQTPRIVAAGKYSPVRPEIRNRVPIGEKRVNIISIPPKDLVDVGEWFWKSLREGGFMREYIRREKATMGRRIREVARRRHGFQQNNRSEYQHVATVPARLYHRMMREDRNFWEDDKNIRSLKRDNPELPVSLDALK